MNILLIDANSIMNRAFYGIRPLTTTDGTNTNAVYGFLNILNKHLNKYMPCKVCAAFDVKAPTYRNELYKDYKAGRRAMPDELREQFPLIKEALSALGIKYIEQPGLEADDIIGILSAEASRLGDECIIITGDRDSFQLINEHVKVCLASSKPKGAEDEIYDSERITEKYGLTPEGLIDLKALMGDSSDNIPGVPGIGEKTALNLLHEYGDLDNLYAHTDELRGAVAEKIVKGKDSAYMSKKLGTIIRTPQPGVDLSDVTVPKPDIKSCTEIFSRLQMPTALKKLLASTALQSDQVDDHAPDSPAVSAQIYDTDTLPQAQIIYMLFDGSALLVKDADRIARLQVNDETLSQLDGKTIVMHDAKPFIRLMFAKGKSVNLAFDTLLAAYLLDPSRTSYDLSALVTQATAKIYEPTSLSAALDAVVQMMESKLEQNGQTRLYYDIELPLCSVLADMENEGVGVDTDFLKAFGKTMDAHIAQLTQSIYDEAGEEFNINSPKQLAAILFEKLRLPVIKKTKSGYSTNNEVLEKLLLRTGYPIIRHIIDYRKYTKLKSTYVDGLLSKTDQDGRIRSIFTQTVTQTGRISSTEPNLQNIPIRTELGSQLRRAFVAKEGCVLLDADYSQIELRVLADIAHDDTMAEAFRDNKDIHTITASQVFGIPESMVTPEWRRRAKAVNFGIVYGIGEYSLSQDIGTSVKEAKKYISDYLQTYHGVRQYMHDVVESAKQKGYVETKFHRRRYVPDINAKNYQLRSFSERVCMNTPIQGTAADIIKLAMVRVRQKLAESGTGAKLILQIHDELIVEVPQEHSRQAAEILKTEMQNVVKLSVPLVTDVGCGKTWFDAKA